MSTGRPATRSYFRYSQESAISSLRRILSFDPSRFGDIIYDPFLGSDTTVILCHWGALLSTGVSLVWFSRRILISLGELMLSLHFPIPECRLRT
jgi:hypothetical protein